MSDGAHRNKTRRFIKRVWREHDCRSSAGLFMTSLGIKVYPYQISSICTHLKQFLPLRAEIHFIVPIFRFASGQQLFQCRLFLFGYYDERVIITHNQVNFRTLTDRNLFRDLAGNTNAQTVPPLLYGSRHGESSLFPIPFSQCTIPPNNMYTPVYTLGLEMIP